MKVVDANVLLYAVNTDSRWHASTQSWLDTALRGHEPVAFSWIVLLAFLRISTRQGIFPNPLSPLAASDTVEAWLAQPGAIIAEPTTRYVSVLRGLLDAAGTAGNLVNDAHIAALAIEHGAEIVSFDNDFHRFEGVRRYQPTAP